MLTGLRCNADVATVLIELPGEIEEVRVDLLHCSYIVEGNPPAANGLNGLRGLHIKIGGLLRLQDLKSGQGNR